MSKKLKCPKCGTGDLCVEVKACFEVTGDVLDLSDGGLCTDILHGDEPTWCQRCDHNGVSSDFEEKEICTLKLSIFVKFEKTPEVDEYLATQLLNAAAEHLVDNGIISGSTALEPLEITHEVTKEDGLIQCAHCSNRFPAGHGYILAEQEFCPECSGSKKKEEK